MEAVNINWKNHVVELFVVFIGITLAFTLNNWRENSKDRELEQQYIKSFYDEIDYTTSRLDSVIIHNKVKKERLKKMIPLMESENMPIDSAIVAISLMAEINMFIGKTNTYESIKNSGNFNIIQNFKVRSKIIEYYESYKGKDLVESYYKMYIDNYSIPFIIENLNLVNGKIVNPKSFKGHEINNLIIGYYQLLVQVINNYEDLAALNKTVKELIENVLQPVINEQ